MRRLALLRELPVEAAMRRAIGLLGRKARAAFERKHDVAHSTYAEDAPPGPLVRLVRTLPRSR